MHVADDRSHKKVRSRSMGSCEGKLHTNVTLGLLNIKLSVESPGSRVSQGAGGDGLQAESCPTGRRNQGKEPRSCER